MTKLKTRNISKKISSWNLDPEILQTFEKNPNYKKRSPEIIRRQVPKFQELIKKAQEFFENGKFIDSAKVFRQLARVTRQIEYDCEVKGDYNEKNQLNDLTGKEWLRHTKSWLVIDGKPSDIPDEIKDHPASYPPDLAKHFIEFFTKEDDWVFDPFMGIGSTLVACMELKRNCWGVELNPKYAEYAQKRTITSKQTQIDEFVKQTGKKKVYNIFNADCRESFKIWEEMKYPKIKFLFTSPP
ncbi:MAG: DNA methyltransferase, partial [Promethearchaeota archaeon]